MSEQDQNTFPPEPQADGVQDESSGAPTPQEETTSEQNSLESGDSGEVSGDEVSGDEVSGDEVSGDEVSGDEVSGDALSDPGEPLPPQDPVNHDTDASALEEPPTADEDASPLKEESSIPTEDEDNTPEGVSVFQGVNETSSEALPSDRAVEEPVAGAQEAAKETAESPPEPVEDKQTPAPETSPAEPAKDEAPQEGKQDILAPPEGLPAQSTESALEEKRAEQTERLRDNAFQKLLQISRDARLFEYFQGMRLTHRYLSLAGLNPREHLKIHPPLFSSRQERESFLSLSASRRGVEIETHLFALYGPLGITPESLTDRLIKADNEAQTAPRDLLDRLLTQLHELYFEYWLNNHTAIRNVEFGHSESYRNLLSFNAGQPRAEMEFHFGSPWALSPYHKLTMRKNRSIKGLRKILMDYFTRWEMNFDLQVEEFLPSHMTLARSSQSELGGRNRRLGLSSRIGDHFKGSQGGLTLKIAFPDAETYFNFILRSAVRIMVDLTAFYFKFQVRIVFEFRIPEPSDPYLLEQKRDQLGVSAWLSVEESEKQNARRLLRPSKDEKSVTQEMRSVILETQAGRQEEHGEMMARLREREVLPMFGSGSVWEQMVRQEEKRKQRHLLEEYENQDNRAISEVVALAKKRLEEREVEEESLTDFEPVDRTEPPLDTVGFSYAVFDRELKRILAERHGELMGVEAPPAYEDPVLNRETYGLKRLMRRIQKGDIAAVLGPEKAAEAGLKPEEDAPLFAERVQTSQEEEETLESPLPPETPPEAPSGEAPPEESVLPEGEIEHPVDQLSVTVPQGQRALLGEDLQAQSFSVSQDEPEIVITPEEPAPFSAIEDDEGP